MVEDRITNKELHYARVKGIKLTRKLYIAHLKEKKSDPFMDNVINYITSKKKI
jgi:nucleoside diphosphate kinase